MSFILLLFHIFIFLVTLARNGYAAAFHDGCWALKFFLVGASYFASLWMPNQDVYNYMTVCSYLGTIFLVYQALLMLVTAYKVNDNLVSNYERDQGSCSGIILAGLTLVLTGLNITWIVLQFMTFSGCAGSDVIMSVTVIGVVAMHALVLLRSRKDASILTSAIASLYCLYLQWTALSSDASVECNPNLSEHGTVVW